jgi:hypothetical protein
MVIRGLTAAVISSDELVIMVNEAAPTMSGFSILQPRFAALSQCERI